MIRNIASSTGRVFSKVRWAASLAMVGLVLLGSLPLVEAKTPRSTLVMAFRIDDIVTLDPAAVFEFSGVEYVANTYDRLVRYDPKDVSKIYGMLAKFWKVSPDGKTYTFFLRDEDMRFASGNPLTAEDVVYSLQRVIKLNKSPAFILSQFGFKPENVATTIRATDDRTVVLTTNRPYAPTFFLYCLASSVGSVVDSKLLTKHEIDGDMGSKWLASHHAGSGPFKLQKWQANSVLSLKANLRYWDGAPKMKGVYIKHVMEESTQRLLLEKGDVDVVRNVSYRLDNANVIMAPKGWTYYLGLNQKNKYLQHPKVREAIKYLVDYEGIAKTVLKDQVRVHQGFVPQGFLGALKETPFRYNPEKAKQLLAEAGYPNGFTVKIDAHNVTLGQALQQSFARGGVTLEIVPGDSKQILTKYRARNHEIFMGTWGPDYQDPHSNADTFSRNPDNADSGTTKTVAWRNAWDIPELTKLADAAVMERNTKKREKLYQDLQKKHLKEAPLVVMFQKIEIANVRKWVKGFVLGPSSDTTSYRHVSKG